MVPLAVLLLLLLLLLLKCLLIECIRKPTSPAKSSLRLLLSLKTAWVAEPGPTGRV